MFERRLKIFLLGLLLATLGLLVRAAQIQVAGHDQYVETAAKLAEHPTPVETTRGQILDATGKVVLAEDEPCTDACVEYPAIEDPLNPAWVTSTAKSRLLAAGVSLRKLSAEQRERTIKEEESRVVVDVNSMWAELARWYQPGPDDTETDPQTAVDDIRRDIRQQVTIKLRSLWYHNFLLNKHKSDALPRWEKWLAGESNDGPDIGSLPKNLDDVTKAYVILPNINQEAVNALAKESDRFPGLVLQARTLRVYPMNTVACQLLGRLGGVSKREQDAANGKLDEWKKYLDGDLIGESGIEKLCEPLLRGSRGEIERDSKGKEVETTAPGFNMHGAIVLIDVKTSNVIAMASNPDFDANVDSNHYAAMDSDWHSDPRRDRATLDAFEPGSTVKPMVGAAGITSGVLKPLEGIECTGYLVLPVLGPDGRPVIGPDGQTQKIREPTGRCWVASEWSLKDLYDATKDTAHPITSYAHHPIPLGAPHRGHDGNPDGFLTYSDALERSCNVFFETVADRLSWRDEPGLAYWYSQFGFGRSTGIGIEEYKGLLPGMRPMTPGTERMTYCFAGIGEGQIWATPLQIANEAATFARGGIWMRPRLLTEQTQAMLDAQRPRDPNSPPDRVDLHLDPAALEQARIGMREVVNDPGGTGTGVYRKDMVVAGKTGTAQGTPVMQWGMNEYGESAKVSMMGANRSRPPTGNEWYRTGDLLNDSVIHAWFMGYAPANDPQVAFCVLVEYAGEGGGNGVAGSVANRLLDAAIEHGYLHPTAPTVPMAANVSN